MWLQHCLIFHIIKDLVSWGSQFREVVGALVKAAAGAFFKAAMALEEGKVRIEKFDDGSDFGFWKMQIEDYLYQKKLYLPLTRQKPTDMEQAEWDLLDRQTLGVIRLTCDISQECCVQYHEREHNRRFDEGIVKYV